MRTTMRTAFAALAALAMAACAGNAAAAGDGGEGEFLRVTVENDGTIPTHIRVYLVKGAGAETLVGTMSTLGRETMAVTVPTISGSYYLRAEGGTGYVLTSPRVSLRGNEAITWDMRQNVIRRGTQ